MKKISILIAVCALVLGSNGFDLRAAAMNDTAPVLTETDTTEPAPEKITDPDVIREMLIRYIEENNIPAWVYSKESAIASEGKNVAIVTYSYRHEDVPELIYNFANENNIAVELIVIIVQEGPFMIEPNYVLGDFSNDGTVTLEDVNSALEVYAQSLLGIAPTAEQFEIADIDGSGTFDLTDVICILQYYNYNEVLGVSVSWEDILANKV